MLTDFQFSEKNHPTYAVALVIAVTRTSNRATPVSNVLLSVIALFFSSLPETDVTRSVQDPVFAAVFQDEADSPIAQPLRRPEWMSANRQVPPVVRGQAPGGYYGNPPATSPLGAPVQPYQPLNPFGTDPVMPYLNQPAPTIISGVNGPQPTRMGFTPYFDGGFISPSSSKSPGKGHFGIQEYDAALKHSSMLDGDWTFTNTAQFGTRLWDGPSSPDFPGSVFRYGWDFMLTSPAVNGWSAQVDFNPSINTDNQSSLGREAFNLDANGTIFYHVSPQFLLVLGVQYWDRVNDIIIPNAGIVWNPTDRLELRLLFPKSRISYFLGNINNGAHWLYATGEYHVESYQINMPGLSAREQVQLSDWRVGVGLRSDHQWYDKYLEVGYVFGRQVDYLRTVPDFNIGDGIMVRYGVRF